MDLKYVFVIGVVLAIAIALVLVASPYPKADDRNMEKTVSGTDMTSHLGVVGEYAPDGFDPTNYLKSWNFNDLPALERKKFYKETGLPDGTMLREYWFYAVDKKIEVAPGVFFDAWTYNGQVPAPTIRAREGDTLRIYFTNNGSKPHTAHFHGYHPSEMDGSLPEDFVNPGESFTYEFIAEPAGLHLFHCHSTPLKDHIARGLYGIFIVDPKEGRVPANELVMMLNAFDTNFDGENEVYAVNTKAFYYVQNPIKVKKNELVRIYVGNMVENDPINSIHIHGNFFNEYKTGTLETPNAFTDIIELGQAERSVLELRFPYAGQYMFHAHQTEFTELGWMGMFEVEE